MPPVFWGFFVFVLVSCSVFVLSWLYCVAFVEPLALTNKMILSRAAVSKMTLFVNSMMWDRMVMKEGMKMKKERGSKE